MLSVAIHIAIIGAATAATVTATPTPIEKPPVFVLRPPAPDKPPVEVKVVRENQANPRQLSVPEFSLPTVVAPNFVPTEIPAIDFTKNVYYDSVIVGNKASPGRGERPGRSLNLDGNDSPSAGAWDAHELMMRIVASGKPRYPESLRQAQIDGRVLVQFTVDTLGRIDLSTVKVLESTHDLFSRAVREALPSFRFKPAQVDGKRVRSLAEMPFEFAITK